MVIWNNTLYDSYMLVSYISVSQPYDPLQWSIFCLELLLYVTYVNKLSEFFFGF